jgi:hypothetical protein
MEDLGIPFQLRFVIYRLYEQVIAKLKISQGWLEDVNCNIGLKQGCLLSPTLFRIYIDNLEMYLEDVRYKGTNLHYYISILLLYVDNIILLVNHLGTFKSH